MNTFYKIIHCIETKSIYKPAYLLITIDSRFALKVSAAFCRTTFGRVSRINCRDMRQSHYEIKRYDKTFQ